MSQKILIVEDNPMNMELAVDLLEYAGYGVLQAVTAEEALLLVRAERPDLVLMDIALPGMDGLEATRRLHRDAVTRDIPVVALTASAMQADEERAFQAGCRGIIRKPIDTREFPRLVASYLEAGPAAAPEKGSGSEPAVHVRKGETDGEKS